MTEDPGAIGPDLSGKNRPDDGSQSLTRLIAPVFAAFTLTAIATFSSNTTLGQPWHDIVLSLLIAATGLFAASIQFSIGTLYERYPNLGKFRAGLTLVGLAFVTASLFFAIRPAIDSLWLWLPLSVLLVGGLIPGLWILWLEAPAWRRAGDSSGRSLNSCRQAGTSPAAGPGTTRRASSLRPPSFTGTVLSCESAGAHQ